LYDCAPDERAWLIVTPEAVAVTAHVYRYAVQYEDTTTDCCSTHVPVPVHDGAARVAVASSLKASRTIRSPVVTLNVGDVFGDAVEVHPTAGVVPSTRVGAVAITAP
jgi:hypothetical protein